MYNTNDYKVLEKLDIDTSDSTFMQELLFENPVFYYIANEKNRKIYLDAVLDSINNIDIRTKPIECIVIETDLCNIVVCEKTNNYGLYLDNNNFYWIKNKNDIEKIKNVMKNTLA